MPRFRKRPLEVEAIQFTGDNIGEIWDAFGAASIIGPTEINPEKLTITTAHDDMAYVRPGDWIVPDSKPDTFYPIKPDVFEATYSRVDESVSAAEVVEGGDTTKLGPEMFTDGNVISYKGENYFKACSAFVSDRRDGGQTFCVKRVGHDPKNNHEDYNGLLREIVPDHVRDL